MIVVDTNILAYHCLPGPRNLETELLAQQDPDWAAPFLWRSEFRNLLAGYIRAEKMDLPRAEAFIAAARESLLAGEHTVSDHAVLTLVARSRCTAYDCEFVALADALGTVLVTEDKALLSAFPRLCRPLAQALT